MLRRRRRQRVHVPDGTIGLVIAKVGAIPPPGSTLAAFVECNSFQNSQRFLAGGGQRGRQQQVLTSGSYAIDPDLFEVITVNTPQAASRAGLKVQDLHEVTIARTEIGVVVTAVGGRPSATMVGPTVPGHDKFQRPWIFLANGGRQGVQEETLGDGGPYAINPWFAQVIRVPQVLIAKWAKEPGRGLDPIVLHVQGHTIHVGVTVVLRILDEAAPGLVNRTGGGAGLQRFVEKTFAAHIVDHLHKIATRYSIQEFLLSPKAHAEIAAEVSRILEPFGIIAATATVEVIASDEHTASESRRIAIQAEMAQARERIRLASERERERIEHELLVNRVGSDPIQAARILKALAEQRVPQFVAESDSKLIEALLRQMPAREAAEMLRALSDTSDDLREDPIGRGGGGTAVLTDTAEVTIYLSDQGPHERVQHAVEEFLARAGAEVVGRDDPVLGSWFRRIHAKFTGAARSTIAREAMSSAAHALESRFVHAQDAAVTKDLMSNLGPLIKSLEDVNEAVIRVGALLTVKVDGRLIVCQLTAKQQLQLEHNPSLATSPHEILSALEFGVNGSPRPIAELTAPARDEGEGGRADAGPATLGDGSVGGGSQPG